MVQLRSTLNYGIEGVNLDDSVTIPKKANGGGRNFIDLTGQRFNRLLVLSRVENYSQKMPQYLCQCDCGSIVKLPRSSIKSGATKSCGCLSKESARTRFTTHGQSQRSPTFQSWVAMKNRCSNPRQKDWKNYGGRGIIVCERWVDSFANFFEDMGERPKGMTIDRFPNKNGNYEPTNCRWASDTDQSQNRRKKS